MNAVNNIDRHHFFCNETRPTNDSPLRFSPANERKILKIFLLGYLHNLLCEIFEKKNFYFNINTLESYAMDSKIIQLLIQGIVETGEYTLEGIAYHTRIPFDIVYDAACGINNHFSITPWTKVVDLYMKVRPDIAQVLLDRLLEMKSKNDAAFSLLLLEE